jgi:hypothetical protein
MSKTNDEFPDPTRIATGSFIPYGIQQEITKKEQEEESQKQLMDSIMQIAESSKINADIALETSKKADVKGWLAVIIAAATLILELLGRLGII